MIPNPIVQAALPGCGKTHSRPNTLTPAAKAALILWALNGAA